MYALRSPAFWAHLFTQFHCYFCGSEEGYSSRRRSLFEREVLPWLYLRPVRCGVCFRRFYLPASVPLRSRGQALNSISDSTLLPLISRGTNLAGNQHPDSAAPPKRVA